jgi:hypothetical protein
VRPQSALAGDLGLEALERQPDRRRGAGIGDEIGRDREVAARNPADLERLADGLERPVRAKLGAGPGRHLRHERPVPVAPILDRESDDILALTRIEAARGIDEHVEGSSALRQHHRMTLPVIVRVGRPGHGAIGAAGGKRQPGRQNGEAAKGSSGLRRARHAKASRFPPARRRGA